MTAQGSTGTTEAAALDRHLGIPGVAEVGSGNGGLTKVAITSPCGSGEMYLLGAQVTSWRPSGLDEVLFVSRQSRWEAGRAIRGGVPICFPWFGNHVSDSKAAAHGFVRAATWRLDAIERRDAGVEVTMSLESEAQTRSHWPFDARVLHRATFGAALQLELIVVNTGTSAFTFEEALHTYFTVGDATTARVAGLDRVRYLDKVDGGRERVQEDEISIAAETDRVYLDTDAAVDIADPTVRRRIRIEKAGSRSTVVWNPWTEKARALADLADDEWRRFVCVETANVGPQAITLEAGEQHVMTMTVRVG